MVNIKINNMPLTVKKGTRVIDAAKLVGIDIPHFVIIQIKVSKRIVECVS